jgi:hypothetical protein
MRQSAGWEHGGAQGSALSLLCVAQGAGASARRLGRSRAGRVAAAGSSKRPREQAGPGMAAVVLGKFACIGRGGGAGRAACSACAGVPQGL